MSSGAHQSADQHPISSPDAKDTRVQLRRCPYLGLRADPTSIFAQPTEDHRCYVTKGRQRIGLDHQAAFCLTSAFEECPRYVPLSDQMGIPALPRPSWFRRFLRELPLSYLVAWVVLVVLGAAAVYAYLTWPMTGTTSTGGVLPIVLPSPSLTAFPTEVPTATPTAALPTPTPAPPTPTLLPGRLQAVLVPTGNAVGWVSSAERLNHFGDRNLHAGVFEGHVYHGAMQFNLASIPLGARIEHVTMELMGLNAENLDPGRGGTWTLHLLGPEMDEDWPSATYEQIHNARIVDTIGPELSAQDLAVRKVNVFSFTPTQCRELEQRLKGGLVSFRLDGPGQGPDNLFTWDTGYGGGFGSRPVLRVIYQPPPTPTPVVITATPTPANVLTAVAVIAYATHQAEVEGTPTPLPPYVITATPSFFIITNTPTPENVATAEWVIAMATAEAFLYGTPTPAPVPIFTTTPWPTETATPVLVRLDDEAALPVYVPPTPTPTPTAFPSVLVGKIAFHSDRLGGDHIFVMDPDGGDVALLTDEWPYEAALAAQTRSSDGHYLAQAGWGDNASDVFVMDSVDGTVVQVTQMVSGTCQHPAWSPDGQRIAFASNRDGDNELFIALRAVGPVHQLTRNLWRSDGHPSWSPDGAQIVYVSSGIDGHQQIWVVNFDGTNPHNISSNSHNDWNPVWIKPPPTPTLTPSPSAPPGTRTPG